MGEYPLMVTGVVDVGGTYDPSALPAPHDQVTKIYKVSPQLPRQSRGITSVRSSYILLSFFSYGA